MYVNNLADKKSYISGRFGITTRFFHCSFDFTIFNLTRNCAESRISAEQKVSFVHRYTVKDFEFAFCFEPLIFGLVATGWSSLGFVECATEIAAYKSNCGMLIRFIGVTFDFAPTSVFQLHLHFEFVNTQPWKTRHMISLASQNIWGWILFCCYLDDFSE